jgi:pimeloyl-ACP methyl ester carboxylesterase
MNWQLDSVRLSRRRFLTGAAVSAAAILARRQSVSAAEPLTSEFVENLCGVVRLPDGRQLAYAEYGDPAAKQIIIHHHGFSSCRLDIKGYGCALMARPGVRMYAIDRPGIGKSSCHPCGNFQTWAADIKSFADALHLKRFAVSGASGGAPYALAVARALPDHVTAVVLACPMAPLEAVSAAHSTGAHGALLAQKHPVAARMALNQSLVALKRNPNRLPGALLTMSPADRDALAGPAERQLFVEATLEAYCQGTDQLVHAAAQLADPWACWLNDVSAKVTIMQGCADRIVSLAMARYLVSALPNAEARFYPDDGHASLLIRHKDDFLNAALIGG